MTINTLSPVFCFFSIQMTPSLSLNQNPSLEAVSQSQSPSVQPAHILRTLLSKWQNRVSRRWLLWLLTELNFNKMLLDFLPRVYKTNCPVRLLLSSFGLEKTKGKSIRVESFEATAGEASPFPPMSLSESTLHFQPRMESQVQGLRPVLLNLNVQKSHLETLQKWASNLVEDKLEMIPQITLWVSSKVQDHYSTVPWETTKGVWWAGSRAGERMGPKANGHTSRRSGPTDRASLKIRLVVLLIPPK